MRHFFTWKIDIFIYKETLEKTEGHKNGQYRETGNTGYPMLPVSLYCPFLCIQCCQFLCIVHSYVSNVASFSVLSILMYPMLPVNTEKLATLDT
jgi:hypothetical protein